MVSTSDFRGPTSKVSINLARDVRQRVERRRRAKGGKKESFSLCAEWLLRGALDTLDERERLDGSARPAGK